jgi:hypothetical protein
MKKQSFLVFSCLFIISLCLYILGSKDHLLAQNVSDESEDINKPGFLKNPKPPSFKDNKDIPENKLINKEKAIGKKPEKSEVKGASLKKWGEAQQENLGTANIDDISPDRKVWEVLFYLPEGVEVGGDKYYNSTVTKVVDAETGQLLYFKVSAKPDQVVRGKRNSKNKDEIK